MAVAVIGYGLRYPGAASGQTDWLYVVRARASDQEIAEAQKLYADIVAQRSRAKPRFILPRGAHSRLWLAQPIGASCSA